MTKKEIKRFESIHQDDINFVLRNYVSDDLTSEVEIINDYKCVVRFYEGENITFGRNQLEEYQFYQIENQMTAIWSRVRDFNFRIDHDNVLNVL